MHAAGNDDREAAEAAYMGDADRPWSYPEAWRRESMIPICYRGFRRHHSSARALSFPLNSSASLSALSHV